MENVTERIKEFTYEYYKLLDAGADVEKLLAFFSDDFVIVEGEDVIDSKEVYVQWYEAVKANILNRKHTLEAFDAGHVKNDMYLAKMKIHFSAETPDGSKIEMRGVIDWLIKLDDSGKLTITEYEIKI